MIFDYCAVMHENVATKLIIAHLFGILLIISILNCIIMHINGIYEQSVICRDITLCANHQSKII